MKSWLISKFIKSSFQTQRVCYPFWNIKWIRNLDSLKAGKAGKNLPKRASGQKMKSIELSWRYFGKKKVDESGWTFIEVPLIYSLQSSRNTTRLLSTSNTNEPWGISSSWSCANRHLLGGREGILRLKEYFEYQLRSNCNQQPPI